MAQCLIALIDREDGTVEVRSSPDKMELVKIVKSGNAQDLTSAQEYLLTALSAIWDKHQKTRNKEIVEQDRALAYWNKEKAKWE